MSTLVRPGVPVGGFKTVGQIRATNQLVFRRDQNAMGIAVELLTTHTPGAPVVDERGEFVDFGTYPTHYTSLHYVSVDYLLDRLVQNQTEIARACEEVSQAAEGDAETAELLRDITAAERQFLDELRRLAPGS